MIRRDDLRDTLRLALPVVLTQLGSIAMGTIDILMVGRLGAGAISAVGLGSSVGFLPLIIGSGVLMGLDPIVAQAFGAGRLQDCGRAMRHGVLLALFVTIPIMAVQLQARAILTGLHEPAPLVVATAPFMRIWSLSTLPFLAFQALRQFLQGIGIVAPAMWIVLGANVLNIVANWILIFGHCGSPALGIVGSAWATTMSRWVMFGALAAYVVARPFLRRYAVVAPRGPIDWGLLRRLLRLGGPVGMQYGMEVGVFSAASVMMGWLGTVPLAAHQVAINLCTVTFMVPLGFSATAAVRVGHALGRDDVGGARRAAFVAYLLGVGFMFVAALSFAFCSRSLAGLYTHDASVLDLASRLLLVGAVFQMFDGAQTIGIGALRGAADTRVPMYVTIVSYWFVGLPLGWTLAFRAGGGPLGLWWGLTAGLVGVAVSLAWRFHHRVRGERLALLKVH